MDKLKTVYGALKETKIPCVYRAWEEGAAPSLPFLCYYEEGSDNFAADNKVYHSAAEMRVELYTEGKEPETESAVEEALGAFVWEKTEVYIDSERCYLITYTFEI